MPKTWQDRVVDSTGVVGQVLGERMSRKKTSPRRSDRCGCGDLHPASGFASSEFVKIPTSCAVIELRCNRPPPNISPLPASRTTLLLPRTLHRKLLATGIAGPDSILTMSYVVPCVTSRPERRNDAFPAILQRVLNLSSSFFFVDSA